MSSQQFTGQAGSMSGRRESAPDMPAQGSGGALSATTYAKLRAGIVAVAPAVLLAGVASHPYVVGPADKEQLAAALTAGPTRWGLAHFLVALGSGLLALAFLAIRSYLRDAGEQRWSIRALPTMIMASVLFGLLPAFEIGILAGSEAGADVAAAQAAIDKWFIPTLVMGSLLFLLGSIWFAKAIIRSGAFPSRVASFAAAALLVAAVSRLVPLGAALYVGGAAVAAALWPLAVFMGKQANTPVS